MRVRAAIVAVVLVVAACSGDDDAAGPTTTESTVPITTTTRVVDTGGIQVPVMPDSFPVAVPDLGFGIAVPQGWQATLLSEDALSRIEGANLAEPFFVDAARKVAETGAVFYAAGIDEDGRVAELKIDVQSGADTTPEAILALAQEVVADESLTDATVLDDLDGGRVRVDYQVELASAEDGTPIETHGSQLFVPDGDRLWSLIVTSEDEAVQAVLLDVFQTSFVTGSD